MALAMGSKEAAISAPLVVLLYDRVFLSPSWRGGVSPALGVVCRSGVDVGRDPGLCSPGVTRARGYLPFLRAPRRCA